MNYRHSWRFFHNSLPTTALIFDKPVYLSPIHKPEVKAILCQKTGRTNLSRSDTFERSELASEAIEQHAYTLQATPLTQNKF